MRIELGKQTNYNKKHSAQILCPIPRAKIHTQHFGFDIWRCYEFFWHDANFGPQTAVLQIIYDCNSSYIVESKSLKLYLGSFYTETFVSTHDVLKTICRDLTYAIGRHVQVTIADVTHRQQLPGECIDTYNSKPQYNTLNTTNIPTNGIQTVHSHLFRSICPVTSQPDWASIVIQYSGMTIPNASLKGYLLSFQNHPGFHEACISTIFTDILTQCTPQTLSVQGYFTRRGGIDINPIRSSMPVDPCTLVTSRQ